MHSLRRGDLCRHVLGFPGLYIRDDTDRSLSVFQRSEWEPIEPRYYREWRTETRDVKKFWTKIPEYEEV